jgi:ABC-type antimicrobial peptide transport system permease subunit
VKNSKRKNPPRWARQFLEWYCRPDLLEDLQGDLREYFEKNLQHKGNWKASVIYTIDVIKFVRLYTVRKPQPVRAMSELIVFQNYFKTSLRNIARNKFFSLINIAGLAVAMCVGLLVISLLAELKSFDDFHANADRIYRVDNLLQNRDGSSYKYATTSVLTGGRLKEAVPGIEDVVIVRRGFDKDVHYENKVISLKGFWADESFLQVFSFRMVEGNSATALMEPNSVVFTVSSARKLFGDINVVGKGVRVDSIEYLITGVVEDPPLNSHMKFEMLGSFTTIDAYEIAHQNTDWLRWDNMWSTYVYILLSHRSDLEAIESALARISDEENKTIENNKISLFLEPLGEIVLGRNMSNSIGSIYDRSAIATLGILAGVVILSACFNYTNLSIARALRRTREVGIRKVIGASRRQIFNQFIFESTILSIISMGLAFLFFLLVRGEFLAMDVKLQEMVTLKPAIETYLFFIGFAILVGILAGILPASFFSKINASRILKDFSSVKIFGHVNLRKSLITFQYILSILFIVMVSIGYNQYRYSLNFDLGFETKNIFTIELQGNRAAPLIKELSELHEVKQIAQAHHISSVGANMSGNVQYEGASDSTIIHFNFVDQAYIPLHEHKLISGENFGPASPENSGVSEVIINQKTMKWMQLTDPLQAVGEEIIIDGQKSTVVGVIEDFHYERINYPIQNFAFRSDPKEFQVVGLKIESADMVATMDRIQALWKKFDMVHPLEGKFYQDHINSAYDKLSWILKIIGSIAFLAILIASLGLLGMVIFTTEKRVKEISIRKVLGASEVNLVLLLSKGFVALIIVSSLVAIPCAYYFMDSIVFGKLVYRAPIGVIDLLIGTAAVMGVALIMIGSQTLRVARSNPAETLKNE